MLRRIIMTIYSVTRIEPDKIMTIFIIIGSLAIFEIGNLVIKKLFYRRFKK